MFGLLNYYFFQQAFILFFMELIIVYIIEKFHLYIISCLSPYKCSPSPPVLTPHPPFPGNHWTIFFVHMFVYIPHISEIMWCLFFSVWLISLNIIPSSSTHVVLNGTISSFLWLSSIPLYIHTISSLSNHQSLGT